MLQRQVPAAAVIAVLALLVAVLAGGVVLAGMATSSTASPSGPGVAAASGSIAARSSLPAGQSSAPAGTSPGTAPAPATSHNSSPAASSGLLPGDLLIADRGNDRLLIVTPARQIIWSMTIDPGGPRGSQSWGPDDAFFTPDGAHIVINQENAHTVSIIDIATRKIVWQYGHTGRPGSAPGYLNGPDDAYVLPDGTVTVADIRNERVLFISPSKKIVRQVGLTGVRRHDPPVSYAAPNGDVPLADGGMLVTEIGGSWVDRLDASGRLVWAIHLRDIAYPSDAQLLPNGNVLVVDYSTPGQIEEVTPAGSVVWRYDVRSGPGMLSNPSLAVRLSNGNIAVTDDFGQTVDVIDPATHRIVWQYGHLGVPGTAADHLYNPDGLDPVPASTAALLSTLAGSTGVAGAASTAAP